MPRNQSAPLLPQPAKPALRDVEQTLILPPSPQTLVASSPGNTPGSGITSVSLQRLQRSHGNRAALSVLQAKRNMGMSSDPAAQDALTVPPQAPHADRANDTGLPNNLKAGVERLSGISLENVKVHYNSSKPAQLDALAYAQGAEIHVAPGQEQYLPHEAWHVVQQAQGRVKPTMQLKEGVPVNDEQGLEQEADVMGNKAIQRPPAEDTEIRLGAELGKRAVATGVAAGVQRKIKLRKGEEINSENCTKMLTGKIAQDVHELVWHEDTSLANNLTDVQARASGKSGAILTPHRHLIGENHAESQFSEVKKSWDWSAAVMDESDRTSPSVDDPKRNKKRLPMEDIHASVLFLLRRAQGLISDLIKLRLKETDENKMIYKKKTSELGHYITHLQPSLKLYKPLFEGVKINDNTEIDLKEVYKMMMKVQCASWTKFPKDTAESVNDRLSVVINFIFNTHQKDHAQEAKLTKAATDWNEHTSNTNILREAHMIRNIEKLKCPGIVCIGRDHVTNFRTEKKTPAESKIYLSFTDFEDEIKKSS